MNDPMATIAMLREALSQCTRAASWEEVQHALAATDAEVTAWLQARERAAAEKMRQACAAVAEQEADEWRVEGEESSSRDDSELCGERETIALGISTLIRALDVDEVLKDSPPPATPGGTAPHQERGT